MQRKKGQRHRDTATPSRRNSTARHFGDVAKCVDAAGPNNNMMTRHIIAAAQHIGAAIQHNYSTTQHIAAVIQDIAVSTRLSDNDIRRLADFLFTSDEDFNDTDSEIGQMLDD
ncbi:hypothetical protein PoB_000628500 [Plakobranchus ocellatus]|uniref:Uncharacterized protein n=1 Tax=Plakobranchus ocellatus TaxID=259542 RepID=A0AAV3YBA8_9GAST|nr:hypothetical protein PoB_000628500 [Plakobranchus ocellatus]